VSGIGDINGDGLDDVVVGAPTADLNGLSSGASYVVFGKADGFSASLDLVSGESGLTGDNGFRLVGSATGDLAGMAVSGAGDINGDGYDDLIVSAITADGSEIDVGVTYVMYGKSDGFDADVTLSSLAGNGGFSLTGGSRDDFFGNALAGAGDVNGDGYDDLIVGANGTDFNGSGSGAAYVFFGAADFQANVPVSSIDGSNGFRVSGIAAQDNAGGAVARAGDFNGDGYEDLIVGAVSADSRGENSGSSYVVFGKAGGFDANLALSDLNGVNGFTIAGQAPSDSSGGSVSGAGDFNGDGYDDILIGTVGLQANRAYILFGAAGGFSSTVYLHAPEDAPGFRLEELQAFDRFGSTVAVAGDVNGDGFDDMLFGAPSADPDGRGEAGATYVVFGFDSSSGVDYLGGADDDVLAGTAGSERFVAGTGNDTLTGGGGADVFRGGQGNDRIEIADATFFDVDGGTGIDTLALVGEDLALDLTAIANSKVTGIERIDLVAGNGENSLTLSLGEVLNISDTSNTLTIDGDGDDAVTVVDGEWSAPVPDGDYNVYTLGAAMLRIDADIHLTMAA
jgi:hypothetical protein